MLTPDDADRLAPHVFEPDDDPETDETRATGPRRVAAPHPDRIGPYRIKRVIATGGMGSVYEAVQDQPRRTVALKVMRSGLASHSALRRFEYEAQILARLHHPGIAQIYEAGTQTSGTQSVPFFVMEYIPNAKPVTEYASERRLSQRDRIRLFIEICDAVQHGHGKGIIHRDLKPANVLIDSHGHVKVIDFGVARATDSDLAVTTQQTDVGQLVGTVQYMSPEQCVADPHDLDTRSDVYSLGVLLYELLCEQLPYDVSSVQVFEATRLIREQAPHRLSTIDRGLGGDLETIVLKAMDKDRDRRYQSAADLARDLERYLNAEPISARPPSAFYQMRMFARRNRTACAAIAAVTLVLLASSVVASTLAVRAARSGAEAKQQAAIAQAINRFLNEDLLAAVRPEAHGRDVTVLEVLDAASEKLAVQFDDQPLVKASVHDTLGETYILLDRYAAAVPHLEMARTLRLRELGDAHPDTLSSSGSLALAYKHLGRFEEAMQLGRTTLDVRRRVLGPEHVDTLASMNNLAMLYQEMGRLDDAEPIFLEMIEVSQRALSAEAPERVMARINFAALRQAQGRHAEAEVMYANALVDARRLVASGKHWPRILGVLLTGHGECLTALGRYDEAEKDLLEGQATLAEALGPGNARTRKAGAALADLYDVWGKRESAETWRARSAEP